MASIPGFRFDITGASGSQGLLGPKDSWRAYILPRGGYAKQDSSGTLITFDSASVASRFAANDWIQAGLSIDNIRKVSAVGGNSLSVAGSALTVSENDRIFLIGSTQPTTIGSSATYRTPASVIRERDDDGADRYTNSMITSDSNGLIQGFAEANLYDVIIQDGNQTNQGSIVNLAVGVAEGVSATQTAVFGATVTMHGALGVTGTVGISTTLNAHTIHTKLVPVLDVKHPDYGATGDGSTDDTTAIQAAITALRSSAAELYFPPGTYKITDKLSLGTINQRIIRGAGRGVTLIKQHTANTPIFESTEDNTHSIQIKDMELVYNANQASANTAATAISLAGTDNPTDHYYWTLENLTIRGANKGIAINGSDKVGLWSSHIKDCRFHAISVTAIDLRAATSYGKPENVLTHNVISNVGDGITAAGPAVDVQAGTGITINGLDIEGWYNNAITLDGGTTAEVLNVHIEQHNMSTDLSGLFILNNEGNFRLGAIDISNFTVDVATRAYIIKTTAANPVIIVHGLEATATLTSGTCALITCGAAPRYLYFDEPTLSNVTAPIAGDIARDYITRYGVVNTDVITTITAEDATPSVTAGNIFITANSASTTITNFDDGMEGQSIKVIVGDTWTGFDFTGTSLVGNEGVDWSSQQGDHMIGTLVGSSWYCQVVSGVTS